MAVAFTPEIGSFEHFSFVNSTRTLDGGTHVCKGVEPFESFASILAPSSTNVRIDSILPNKAVLCKGVEPFECFASILAPSSTNVQIDSILPD